MMTSHANGFDWGKATASSAKSTAFRFWRLKAFSPVHWRFCRMQPIRTKYDLSGARLTRFEIRPKNKSINLRLSEELYKAVRKRAARTGLPYQRFIRLTLEQAIGSPT